MGASREMTVAAVAEPTILVAIFALSVRAGSSNLAAIVTATLADPQSAGVSAELLAFAALAVVTLAETGRLPVDNPSTHLELTMIHEAMVLEYAGPDLALVELAAHMRLVVFSACSPTCSSRGGSRPPTHPCDLVWRGGRRGGQDRRRSAAPSPSFEVFVAKLRLFRVPELLAASFVLAFLAVTASFFLA